MHRTEGPLAHSAKEKTRDVDEVLSLSRGIDVLKRIAAANAPVSNRELAQWTGIPRSTISRLTATLVSADLLFRLPDGERSVLTASVLELSNGFLRNFDVRARAKLFLFALSEQTGLSIHLAVRNRLDMVVIETIRPRTAMLVSRYDIGARMDIGRTAVGQAYLAILSEADRACVLECLRISSGDSWYETYSRLNAGLEYVMCRGFAIETSEGHDELNAVAARFVGPSGERYVMNCGGADYQASNGKLLDIVATALAECIGKITKEIGGAPTARLSE